MERPKRARASETDEPPRSPVAPVTDAAPAKAVKAEQPLAVQEWGVGHHGSADGNDDDQLKVPIACNTPAAVEKFCSYIGSWMSDVGRAMGSPPERSGDAGVPATFAEVPRQSDACRRCGCSWAQPCPLFQPLPSLPTIFRALRRARTVPQGASTATASLVTANTSGAGESTRGVRHVVAHRHWAHASHGTGIVYDERMLLHASQNPEEFERPGRLERSISHLRAIGLLDRCHRMQCPSAKTKELRLVHTIQHIDHVDHLDFLVALRAMEKADRRLQQECGVDAAPHCSPAGTPQPRPNFSIPLTVDLYASAGTARAARLAAGGVVQAARSVCSGEVRNAFAMVRPPGHHCSATSPSGFCFFNNVAVGVRVAQQMLRHQWERALAVNETAGSTDMVRNPDEPAPTPRVMIIDWDVHHCDGTESIFYDDPTVLVVSIHQHRAGRGHVLRKVPSAAPALPHGSGPSPDRIETQHSKNYSHEEMEGIGVDELTALLESESDGSHRPSSATSPPSKEVPQAGPEQSADPVTEEPVANRGPAEQLATGAALGKRPRKPVDYALLAADLGGADDDVAAAAALGVQLSAVTSLCSDDEWSSDTSDGSTELSSSCNGGPPAPFHHPGDTEGLSWDADSRVSGHPMYPAGNDDDDGGQDYFYPGTGHLWRTGGEPELQQSSLPAGNGSATLDDPPSASSACGRNINIPWPTHGFGDVEYLTVFDELILPVAHEFMPDIVFVSCGFDSADGDLLGSMRLTPTGYYLMTKTAATLSSRLVVVLEGGYNLSNVARCSEAVLRAMLEAGDGYGGPLPRSRMLLSQCQQLIEDVKSAHRPYWKHAFAK